MAKMGIGWEKVVLDGGNGLWGGFDGEGGAPQRSPALEANEMGEPSGVVFWGGEGDDYTGVGGDGWRRRRRIGRSILV